MHQNLIVDELLTKPSAVSPTLFVGLGGCGCRIVRRVSEHLRRRPDYNERYKELVKVALVDTNTNDLEAHREIADETFLISDFEKEEYADLASGKMFLEPDEFFTQWVPPDYRFRAGDTAGAGQIRIEARLGVFYQMKHKGFVAKFRRLLEALKSHEHGHRRLDSSEIRIILCYSVAGGTGSGCHLPVAYMLRDQARELGRPYMVGVAVLPSVFQDKTGINKDGTFANGYAALKETEYLMRLGAPDSQFFPTDGREFHYDPSMSSRTKVKEKPFEFVYVVDRPESFTVSDPVRAAADGLYLQFFSPLFGSQISDYDNYTQHQRFLVPHDFEGKGIPGFTSFYGSYGAAVLLVPTGGLVQYSAQAAALSLMRSSFLHAIPNDPVYETRRLNPAPFHEVTLEDGEHEKPIHVADFQRKERTERERLVDRLFCKRVRLLAACEVDEGQAKRYLALFRHGHFLGERPTRDGGFVFRKDDVGRDAEDLAKNGMDFSINALVLPAISSQGNEPAGLLKSADGAIREYARRNPPTTPAGKVTVRDLVNRARKWVEDFQDEGKRRLRDGYQVGKENYPGFESLVGLDFLRREAAAVDLVAKRYAVLSLLERIRWNLDEPSGEEDFDVGLPDSKKLSEKDAQDLMSDLEGQARTLAMGAVRRQFVRSMSLLYDNLKKYADTQRLLEQGFDPLEREQRKQLQRLREQGDDTANQYVLDAEALQIEDGRRMWDFFHEDRVAPLPELSLTHKDVQRVLSDAVTEMSLTGRVSPTSTLQKLFEKLREYAEQTLAVRIQGDPHALDRERREGLTLSDALELEVTYRALYRSNQEDIVKDDTVIRSLVSRYNHQPQESKIQLGDTTHSDYLRDKIKRVVQEKASLLCVYDEAKDQHGGVRPDHVFLAAIDENFKNSTLEDIIKSADSTLHWVTTGWHNPKEIVFYRAVLNVPLYVFGRLPQMKADYQAFRSLARRPKVLHIDRNWEDSLPDLDPDSAEEQHRQDRLRNHIINFSSLYTTSAPESEDHQKGSRLIYRRDGVYYLRHPHGDEEDQLDLEVTPTDARLGESLAEAIAQLPTVLEGEKVKYLPYQQLLRGVREGMSPDVLTRVCQLPFRWRKNRDALHTRYGTDPEPRQELKLKDFSDASQRLREALDTLYEKLHNKHVEQHTLGEELGNGFAGLDRRQAEKNLRESLQLLATFRETWVEVENPEKAGRHLDDNFERLFQALGPARLREELEKLRRAGDEWGASPHDASGNGSGDPEAGDPPPVEDPPEPPRDRPQR
jgi:hypothetical protein